MNEGVPTTEPARRRGVAAFTTLTTQQRIVLAIASFTLAIGLTGVGVYATFTSSASATHSVSTATLNLALGATGASTNRLNVNATGLTAGDTYARSFDLVNTGSSTFSGITLTTSASPSSALDTDATDGLQILLQRCSVAWTESGASPNFSYTCGGTTQTVLASRAVIGTDLALANLGAVAPATTDHVLLRMTLPSTADNSFQGLTSTLTFTFDGTQ